MGKKKKCAGLPRVPHAMRVVDVEKGKRSIAETFFFIAVLKQAGGVKVAQAPTPFCGALVS